MDSTLLCFYCLTDPFDPGDETATTMRKGTPMCTECARTDATNRRVASERA